MMRRLALALALSSALCSPLNAQTLSGGFGVTLPLVVANVTAGTGAASVFVITPPSATNGWVCNGNDITTHSTTVSSVQQTVGTNNATTVTMGAYSDISALAAVGTADHIRIQCIAY